MPRDEQRLVPDVADAAGMASRLPDRERRPPGADVRGQGLYAFDAPAGDGAAPSPEGRTVRGATGRLARPGAGAYSTLLSPASSENSLLDGEARGAKEYGATGRAAGVAPAARGPTKAGGVRASFSFYGLPSVPSQLTLAAAERAARRGDGSSVDWTSIAVVYLVVLTSEAARGLLLPTQWPYLQSVGGSQAMLGVLVGSFSLGRMAATIPLGVLSDRLSMRAVLALSSGLQIVGHLAYGLVGTPWTLVAARVVVGFGSATMSVCRSHIARAIPKQKQTYHFAYLSGLQFVGFAVLPGVGGLLSYLPSNKVFNTYTYPAYVLMLVNAIAIGFLYFCYLDPPAQVRPRGPRRDASTSSFPRDTRAPVGVPPLAPPTSDAIAAVDLPAAAPGSSGVASRTAIPADLIDSSSSEGADGSEDEGPSADSLALIVCLLINVTFRGMVAELETVVTPFLMDNYGASMERASFFVSVLGLFGLLVYFGFKAIAKRYSDRALVLVGLAFLVAGAAPLSLSPVTDALPVGAYVAVIGLMWSLAYPIGQTAVLSLFSKVLAGLPAGGFLGIFSATGSLARVFFAVLAAATWEAAGRNAVFAGIVLYAIATAGLALLVWRRLVPPV